MRLLLKRALKSWKHVCVCLNLQKQSLCARITFLVWPTVTLKNFFGVNSEKIWVNIGIFCSWKDVDNLRYLGAGILPVLMCLKQHDDNILLKLACNPNVEMLSLFFANT